MMTIFNIQVQYLIERNNNKIIINYLVYCLVGNLDRLAYQIHFLQLINNKNNTFNRIRAQQVG